MGEEGLRVEDSISEFKCKDLDYKAQRSDSYSRSA